MSGEDTGGTRDRIAEQKWADAWEKARRKEVRREDRLRAQAGDNPDHDCVNGKFTSERSLGENGDWEFSIGHCDCGRVYIRAYTEGDGVSHSGRWYMARFPVDPVTQQFNPKTLLQVIGRHDRVLVGGSYWGHAGKWFKVDPVGHPRSPYGRDLR